MSKLASSEIQHSCCVELTHIEAQAVHGARWREEVAVPPPPIPDNTVAAMTNAWWIDSCGGVGTGPGVYGEGYAHQGCAC